MLISIVFVIEIASVVVNINMKGRREGPIWETLQKAAVLY